MAEGLILNFVAAHVSTVFSAETKIGRARGEGADKRMFTQRKSPASAVQDDTKLKSYMSNT